MLIFTFVALIMIAASSPVPRVNVFHYISSGWGEIAEGTHECGPIDCEWTVSDRIDSLSQRLRKIRASSPNTTTIAVYNIHAYNTATKFIKPNRCSLDTTLSIAETEESTIRVGPLVAKSFHYFDGHSTINPKSDIPRVYKIASNFTKSDLLPSIPFHKLLPYATFVASDCHHKDKYANSNREDVVKQIRKAGFRVDGLGKCLHDVGPDGIPLPPSHAASDRQADYRAKRAAISQYLFHFAFENTIESGYVSEKPFDALIAGTVPVYLGDAKQLKRLLPHPKAAIFVSDFSSTKQLVKYLKYLTTNETAYEEHRAWRVNYDAATINSKNPLLSTSWQCNVCKWAHSNRNKEVSSSATHKCDATYLRGETVLELTPVSVYALLSLLLVCVAMVARFCLRRCLPFPATKSLRVWRVCQM